jgi:hypothetical protein
MIARFWHASTTREKADAFQEVLRRIIKKRNEIVNGYRGIYLLSKQLDAKMDFVHNHVGLDRGHSRICRHCRRTCRRTSGN